MSASHVIDGPLWARQWRGGKRNLVLLHGFLSDGRAWEPLLPTLLPHFSVLCVDLPGHGRSVARWAPHGSDPWAWQSDALLATTRLAFDQPALLAGYSMGGRVAAHAATAAPKAWSALLLESAHPGLADPADRAERARADAGRAAEVLRDGISEFVCRWEHLPLFASQQRLPKATLDRQRHLRMTQRPNGVATSLLAYGTGVMPPVPSGPWPERVRVLAGELDAAYLAALPLWKTHCPAAVLVPIRDAGHNIHLERPELWLAELSDLADAAAGSAVSAGSR